MNTMIRCCLFVLLITVASNLSAQTNTPPDKKTLQDLYDKWDKAIVAGDQNTYSDFYTEDAFSLPSYSPMMKGKSEIEQQSMKNMGTMKISNLTTTTTDVFGNGDMAIAIGTYDITLTPAKMKEKITDHGKFLTVWQKLPDGLWKIKAHTYNSDVNPMNQTQAGAKEKPKDDDKYKDYR